MKNNDEKKVLPTAEMLERAFTDIANIYELLDFYNSYINKAASVPIIDNYGEEKEMFIVDDLKQEIICRIIGGIPKIKRKYFSDESW